VSTNSIRTSSLVKRKKATDARKVVKKEQNTEKLDSEIEKYNTLHNKMTSANKTTSAQKWDVREGCHRVQDGAVP
jgi:hypothetical protein